MGMGRVIGGEGKWVARYECRKGDSMVWDDVWMDGWGGIEAGLSCRELFDFSLFAEIIWSVRDYEYGFLVSKF